MIALIEKLKNRIEGEDKITLRLTIIFVLAVLTNIFGCAFAYATAHSMIAWVVGLGFLLPIVNFTVSLLFLEAKTLRERLYIMLINSFALAIGGGMVSLYFS